MTRLRRWLRWIFIVVLVLALVGAAAIGGLYYAVSSKLPDVQALREHTDPASSSPIILQMR